MFPILAIETTGELCSAAILITEAEYSEINILGKHVHSEKLLPIVERLLLLNKLEVADIKCIAISEGPGSFTGLRIGMAAAKGLAAGSKIPMVLVPTFDAVANKLKDFLQATQKFIIARKASRDDYYFAKFKNEKEQVDTHTPLSLIDKTELNNKIEDDDIVFSDISDRKELTTPSAHDIGIWAYKFGKDLLTSEYDLLEPKYIKEFVVRK